MFRWPKQTETFNKSFYQLNYITQATPDVHLPAFEDVNLLRRTNFDNHPKSLGSRLEIVKLLNPSGRLLVYGANWGYEVFQFLQAGYDAIGYEVSAPRAAFGTEHLGVSLFHDLESVREKGPFDIIYSSHTLEHLPSPKIAFELFQSSCAATGALVLFVPNCGGENACKEGVRWGPFSSSLHPLSYTGSFFLSALPQYGFNAVSIYSDPYDLQKIGTLSSEPTPRGDELLVVAKKTDS